MSNDVVVQNSDFSVTSDSVKQGPWIAAALSATHLESNYNPTDSADQMAGIIRFRLAFNGHDNEMLPGECHFALRGTDTTTIVACVPDTMPQQKGDIKAKNWTLRVDLRKQMASLKKNGFFVTPTGDTIFSKEFKGVWVAGSISPMTWHFYELEQESKLRLHETAQEGIYELSFNFSSESSSLNLRHEWQIDQPNADYPQLSSSMTLIDALYNMSIEDIANCKEQSGGHSFKRSFNHTRTSYPIILSLAYLNPRESMAALRSSVESGAIKHSHNHSIWPISSDDISWAAAAWEVYVVTGDKAWLRWSYQVIKKTIDAEYAINGDTKTGLVHGGVNFSYSQSQSYPKWMNYKDIYETTSLTSNVLYMHAFEILNDMGDELGIIDEDYGEKAQNIKDAINETLWNEAQGYYNQYNYIAAYPVPAPSVNNFGQALSVLWGVADDNRAENLMMKTPISNFGVPSTCPRYPTDEDVNLSEIMSPMMQAFWNLAAAKTDNENMLRRGLGAMYRAQALACANRAAYNAYTGVPVATLDGDMGSAAGNVAMVFRVFAGMTFLTDGIEFNPCVPVFLKGTKTITGFKYRKATLDITIEGSGTEIKKFIVDGKETNDNFFSAELTGQHTVKIVMSNNHQTNSNVTLAANDFIIPPTPVASWTSNGVRLMHFDERDNYRMMVNGQLRYRIADTTLVRSAEETNLTMSSVVNIGKYSFSYLSRPHLDMKKYAILSLGKFAVTGTHLVDGARSSQMVESSAISNGIINLKYVADEAGDYLMDVRYANGIQSSYCPVYIVTVNGHQQGTLVMPFRGEGEWLNMGMSNMANLELLRGDNTIELKRIGSIGVNDPVLLSFVRLIKK